MIKVLLVSINSKYIHSSLAVWYLKAAAKSHAQIDVLEATLKSDKSQLLEEILEKKADLLAFSCYIWNISFVKELLVALKERCPQQKILLGGPEVSYCASDIFSQFPSLDYILSGEGEEPLSQLVQALAERKATENILGVCTKEHISPPYISKIDPPSPYTQEYFERLCGRIAYIEASRGCPFACSYCLSGRMGSVRFFDLKTVKETLTKLASSGTQTVKFVDRTFNCNEKRALEILEFLLTQNPVYRGVCYHFEMAGDLMSEKILAVLNAAPKGLFQIEVGVQSFYEPTLAAVHRKTNLSKLCAHMRRIIEKGNVHVHMDLIAGLPFEDFKHFKQGFDRLFALRAHQLQLGFLKRLHGSPLQEEEVGDFCETPPYQVISTPWISGEELQLLQKAEDALDRLYNSGRFTSLIFAAQNKGISAFDLFLAFGTQYPAEHKESLESYCEKVLAYFSLLLGECLSKDLMREQWLKTNSCGYLPSCLRDKGKRTLLGHIEKTDPRPKSVKRAAAILYGTREICYVDYVDKDPVSKEYPAKKIPLSETPLESGKTGKLQKEDD